MKKNITVEQVCELSEKAKKSLITWWEVRDGDRYTSGKDINIAGTHYAELAGGSSDEKKQQYLPLLSIVQMIQILDESYKTNWIAMVNKRYSVSNSKADYEDYDELVDALWDAVKDVLEKGGDKK